MSYARLPRRQRGSLTGYVGSGLGYLPTIPVAGITATTAAQYDALRSGQAFGGNFEEFLDAVAQGFFPDSAEGYAQMLAYNSGGTASVWQQAGPSYMAWRLGSLFAAAVKNKQHTGNSTSPLYDPQTGQNMVVQSVAGLAQNNGLSLDQWKALQDEAVGHYRRLLQQWVPGVSLPSLPPDPTPRVSSATPVAAAPVQTRTVLQIVVTKDPAMGAPGDGIHFPTLAWRTIKQALPSLAWLPDTASSWTPWKSSMVNKLSSETVSIVFWEDVKTEVADPRVAAFWNWPALQTAVASSGPGSPPPTTLVTDDVIAAPTSTGFTPVRTSTPTLPAPSVPKPVPSGTVPPPDSTTPTVKPYTDVTVPPPGPTILPPGDVDSPLVSPPMSSSTPTSTVPYSTGGGTGPGFDLVPGGGAPPAVEIPNPADALPALGGVGALFVGVGLLFLLGRRKRR